MNPTDVALLIGGGFLAGIVNTLAGGGSMLTVPLLVMLGLPGGVANGTNRLGLLLQNVFATWRFRAEGVSETRNAVPVLLPVAAGSAVGAFAVSHVADATFERLFGVVMLLLLIPTLRRAPLPIGASAAAPRWSPVRTALIFFGIGLYGGSFQAGSGIALLFALSHAGLDLVRANAVKVIVVAAITLVALPIFASQHQIAWLPGAFLALGFVGGGSTGATLAVRRGEALIRPVLALAVIALAGRMFGLYGRG